MLWKYAAPSSVDPGNSQSLLVPALTSPAIPILL